MFWSLVLFLFDVLVLGLVLGSVSSLVLVLVPGIVRLLFLVLILPLIVFLFSFFPFLLHYIPYCHSSLPLSSELAFLSLRLSFVSTFLITISNPLAIFLFLAFFAGFGVVQKGENFYGHLLLIGGVMTGASMWWFLLTFIINLFRSKINLRRLWWLNKIAGATIVVLVVIAFVFFLIDNPIK